MEADRIQDRCIIEERRYSELRQEGARLLSGVAVRYGEIATGVPWKERFERGAFGNVDGLDVFADVQHERGRLLARTGGGGLVLQDGPEALRLAVDVPETREGDDALTLVRKGVLRGWSVQFRALQEHQDGAVRAIDRARLTRIGLVDVPAYPGSIVEARAGAMPMAEVRAAGEGLAGSFFYNQDHIIGDRAALMDGAEERVLRNRIDRRVGRIKERVLPGAFRYVLTITGGGLERDITVTLGYGFDQPLASKTASDRAAESRKVASQLTLIDGPESLDFEIERLPDTSYVRDFRAALDSGAANFGVAAVYSIPPPDVVPDAVTTMVESEEEGGATIRVINAAVLTQIAIVSRAPRGNPGMIQRRRRWW